MAVLEFGQAASRPAEQPGQLAFNSILCIHASQDGRIIEVLQTTTDAAACSFVGGSGAAAAGGRLRAGLQLSGAHLSPHLLAAHLGGLAWRQINRHIGSSCVLGASNGGVQIGRRRQSDSHELFGSPSLASPRLDPNVRIIPLESKSSPRISIR